jgi:GDP/UDP-N,N'-diacetylbacillosamine 2-epimerase (hydrolysing)
VIRVIEEHCRRHADARAVRSLERGAFLELLTGARLLIGNSSCGIIEAPFLGVPVINVGDRQQGRLAGGGGIRQANESAVAIRRAIERVLAETGRKRRRVGPYGNGRAGERIARSLRRKFAER